jgi:hypothetical protein
MYFSKEHFSCFSFKINLLFKFLINNTVIIMKECNKINNLSLNETVINSILLHNFPRIPSDLTLVEPVPQRSASHFLETTDRGTIVAVKN